jgi:hypothetical protein
VTLSTVIADTRKAVDTDPAVPVDRTIIVH